MVIGEGAGGGKFGAQLAQGFEELLRAADPREGHDRAVSQGVGGVRIGDQSGAQQGQIGGQQGGAVPAVLADQDHRVGAGQTASEALAQRTRGDREAVAEAVAAVHHQERQVLGQAGILEAVVHRQEVRAGGDGRRRAGGPVGPDPGRRGLGQQQGLVAHRGGIVARRIDPQRTAFAAAVAAGQEMRRTTEGGETAGQVERDGGLAGTAGDQIADADHRHRDPRRLGRGPAQTAGQVVDETQGGQELGERAVARGGAPEIRRPHGSRSAAGRSGERSGEPARWPGGRSADRPRRSGH